MRLASWKPVVLSISLLAAQHSWADTVFSAKAASFDGIHSVEYDGIGWRNLRLITLVTTIDETPIAQQTYIACGSGKLLTPNLYATPKDFEVYPGKQRTDQLVIFGGVEQMTSNSFGFDLTKGDDQSFKAAMAKICNAPAKITDEPDGIYLSGSSDAFSELVPSRFSRAGDRISVWVKDRKYRNASGKAGSYDRDFRIVEIDEGHEITKLEIDCSKQALATSSLTSYDREGRVIDSRSIEASALRLEETVPGSVGESKVEVACLLK